MGFQGPPAVDFYSMLSGLGDTIAANRAAQAKKDAFAAATTPGPDGNIDYGKAILGLAQVDPQAAGVLAANRNHEDTIKQQAIDTARNAANDTFNHTYQNATLALQKRAADRADDPTPKNFVADPAAPGGYRPIGPADPAYIANVARATASVPPTGFDPNPAAATDPTAPKYVPQTGGPQDPAYIGSVAAAKAKAESELPGGGGLSLNPVYGKDANGNTVLLQPGKNGVAVQSKLPEGVTLNGVDNETLASDAARLNAGDPNVLKKYSNKGQGRVDLLRLNNEANRQRVASGQDPIDITQNSIALQGDTARERAAGTMEGRMAPAAIEAKGAIKIAQQASNELNRTNFVPFNKILQAGQSAFSNPELKAAATAYNTVVMTYSRAVSPTGVGSVTAQEHAREILATADGPRATQAAFDQLNKEIDMAHASPTAARAGFAAERAARPVLNGGRPIQVQSPSQAMTLPPGTPIILPDGSPGVVPQRAGQ